MAILVTYAKNVFLYNELLLSEELFIFKTLIIQTQTDRQILTLGPCSYSKLLLSSPKEQF